MAHPYIRLLRDRDVCILWGGLTLSAVGSELYGLGAIWLAVGLAGAEGSYLATARFAAVLVMSLGAGAFVDLVSRRVLLIGSDLVRAAFSAVVVVAALAEGLTLPVLILASSRSPWCWARPPPASCCRTWPSSWCSRGIHGGSCSPDTRRLVPASP